MLSQLINQMASICKFGLRLSTIPTAANPMIKLLILLKKITVKVIMLFLMEIVGLPVKIMKAPIGKETGLDMVMHGKR